jgi:hypothetical protein
MNYMMDSLKDAELRFRQYALAKMAELYPSDQFVFDLEEGIDASPAQAGAVFDQATTFWLLQMNVETGRRAGPGTASPRRYWGSLDLALFTKQPRDKVRYTGMLESLAGWFQDQTIDGIRFRTFIPTPPAPMRGFTSYNGVINFEFEISLAR